MDDYTKKDLKTFTRAAKRYPIDHPLRLAWYGHTSEEMKKIYEGLSNLVPQNVTNILEPGVGCGGLAEAIMKKRPDIVYQGFDLIPDNVEACKKILPKMIVWEDNYWNVMTRHNRDWDFIISNGVLFSCTDLKYRPLLFDLLDAVSPKGFIVSALRGNNERGGISSDVLEEKIEKCLSNSIGLDQYYYKGKRDFLPSSLLKWHSIFYVFREGTKAKMPDIPEILTHPLEKKGFWS